MRSLFGLLAVAANGAFVFEKPDGTAIPCGDKEQMDLLNCLKQELGNHWEMTYYDLTHPMTTADECGYETTYDKSNPFVTISTGPTTRIEIDIPGGIGDLLDEFKGLMTAKITAVGVEILPAKGRTPNSCADMSFFISDDPAKCNDPANKVEAQLVSGEEAKNTYKFTSPPDLVENTDGKAAKKLYASPDDCHGTLYLTRSIVADVGGVGANLVAPFVVGAAALYVSVL